MQPLMKEWAYARAALEELPAYLLSREVYWQFSPLPADRAAGQLFSLTPGNLLLCFRKLQALTSDGTRHAEIENLHEKFKTLTRQRRTAWLQKSSRELLARMKLWQTYLIESATETGRLVDYPFQVRWRTILDLLTEDGLQLTEVQSNLLAGLDQQLKTMTVEAPFVWGEEFLAVFSPQSFWYLYRAQRKA